MRQIALLVLGLVLGAATAAVVVNALARRDAYPRGLMAVLQHHYGGLREAARSGRCDADAWHDKMLLGELAAEIEPAVAPDATTAAPFREYAGRLREAIAELPDAPASCPQLRAAVTRVGNACEECHHQYR